MSHHVTHKVIVIIFTSNQKVMNIFKIMRSEQVFDVIVAIAMALANNLPVTGCFSGHLFSDINCIVT